MEDHKKQSNNLKGDKIVPNVLYVLSFLFILCFLAQSVQTLLK